MNTNTVVKMQDIARYEGQYAITDDGRVWSYKSKKYLTPAKNNTGYLFVCLSKNGKVKTRTIHRLVLETFNPVEGMERLQVNHLDECKTNNNLSNLSWTTPSENSQYSSHKIKGKKRGKIKPVAQYSLDGELIAVYPSQAEAARQTGACQRRICATCRGEQHTAGGFIWRYYNEGQEN